MLERAEHAGVSAACISPKSYASRAEFNQALKDAGIDDVIACVQEQLDAWLAEK